MGSCFAQSALKKQMTVDLLHLGHSKRPNSFGGICAGTSCSDNSEGKVEQARTSSLKAPK